MEILELLFLIIFMFFSFWVMFITKNEKLNRMRIFIPLLTALYIPSNFTFYNQNAEILWINYTKSTLSLLLSLLFIIYLFTMVFEHYKNNES